MCVPPPPPPPLPDWWELLHSTLRGRPQMDDLMRCLIRHAYTNTMVSCQRQVYSFWYRRALYERTHGDSLLKRYVLRKIHACFPSTVMSGHFMKSLGLPSQRRRESSTDIRYTTQGYLTDFIQFYTYMEKIAKSPSLQNPGSLFHVTCYARFWGTFLFRSSFEVIPPFARIRISEG